jgi:hypothetical protein
MDVVFIIYCDNISNILFVKIKFIILKQNTSMINMCINIL